MPKTGQTTIDDVYDVADPVEPDDLDDTEAVEAEPDPGPMKPLGCSLRGPGGSLQLPTVRLIGRRLELDVHLTGGNAHTGPVFLLGERAHAGVVAAWRDRVAAAVAALEPVQTYGHLRRELASTEAARDVLVAQLDEVQAKHRQMLLSREEGIGQRLAKLDKEELAVQGRLAAKNDEVAAITRRIADAKREADTAAKDVVERLHTDHMSELRQQQTEAWDRFVHDNTDRLLELTAGEIGLGNVRSAGSLTALQGLIEKLAKDPQAGSTPDAARAPADDPA